MERDRFLSRVAKATMTAQLPSSPVLTPDLPELDDVDLVATMRANAQKVNAVVHGPTSRHGVPRAVVGIAAGHNATSFLAWDDVGVSGVTAALSAQGVERLDHEVPEGDRRDHNQTYKSAVVGVTGASAALAESGTVVLEHGPGKPRMASLIPEVHIVLLPVTVISRTLAHWAAEYPEKATASTNLVFVTGPSRTGDIEQQLNLGVHGPRHVHIVMFR